nr:ABC transporter permease [Pseudorhodoferax sp. Leaf274]
MAPPGRFGPALRRTLWQALPTVVGILVLNFVLLQMVPGDVVDVMAGESGGATLESMAALREQFGLVGSVGERLVAHLHHLLTLNLGVSPRYNVPVTELILGRLPNTLFLVISGLLLAITLGVLVGAAMATWAGRLPDRLLSLANLLLYSTPGFWIGLMLILLFSVKLGWLPANGFATIGVELHGWAWLADRLHYAVLPVATLSTFFIAVYGRLTRAAMLEVRQQDFVRTARSKGLSPARVVFRHVLRNALMPITTVAGLHFAALFGGAAVTETVFGWPGLGRLTLEAVMTRDFNLLLGILLLSSLLVVLVNVLVDLLQLWLDPRIEAR